MVGILQRGLAFRAGSIVAARGSAGVCIVRETGRVFRASLLGIEVARKARPAGRCPVCRPVTRANVALAAFPQPT